MGYGSGGGWSGEGAWQGRVTIVEETQKKNETKRATGTESAGVRMTWMTARCAERLQNPEWRPGRDSGLVVVVGFRDLSQSVNQSMDDRLRRRKI